MPTSAFQVLGLKGHHSPPSAWNISRAMKQKKEINEIETETKEEVKVFLFLRRD